jgi:DNA polymerase III delta prime subunit
MTKLLPWIEKYRPSTLDDILLSPFVKTEVQGIISSGNIPNMIISGEPSTGKSSTINILLKIFKYIEVLELNVSDDRGLNIINSKIIPFCRKTSNNIRLIILDEADAITIKAQYALNGIITKFINTSRFIFICNDPSQIIECIQSKCVLLKYPQISFDLIQSRIKFICNAEDISYDDESITMLIQVHHNDIRQIINSLECIKWAYGKLSKNSITETINKPYINDINNIVKYIEKKDIKKSFKLINSLNEKGYKSSDILYMLKYIYQNNNDIEKLNIVSEAYIRTITVINSLLQLYGCITKLIILP